MSVLERFDLTGRVAVVTGAGRGLGLAIARGLAEAGARLAMVDLAEDTLERGATEMSALGAEVLPVAADVGSPSDMERLAEAVSDRWGRADILVNNAGVVYRPQSPEGSPSIPVEETTVENWRHVMSVNIDGMFLCTQAVGRLMLAAGRGSIINLASMSAFIANKGRNNAAYCASKGAVVSFTRELAAEWGPRGIRVNAIAPGYMQTDGAAALKDPAVQTMIREMTPLGRAGKPEELQGLAVYLAADASAFLTGQTIVIDGGYTLW